MLSVTVLKRNMIFSVIGFKLFAQLGSVFMLGRCLTSLLWGAIVDRIGRKPVILAGIISVVIFNTLFGLSKSFWMAILTIFLLGCFNGFLGPVRNCISTPTSHVVIGLIIGPSLRGYLAQPVEKYPNIFPKNSFWNKFPYFLPNLITSVFALVVAIGCIWIPRATSFMDVLGKQRLNTF
uniref:Major facilitator superfamily (MFS) profile domain-containing protein n=1 Tax=Phaseolus vulgaris TaxID=3885 RepID=V7CLW6_PHAVU|nr:hypothetical protein PHAVU_002G108300g [Phaseolus vulgaris]ESW29906.1 hypothetical protein PHAVU_002G108300g [Phaseolus vulgaris]